MNVCEGFAYTAYITYIYQMKKKTRTAEKHPTTFLQRDKRQNCLWNEQEEKKQQTDESRVQDASQYSKAHAYMNPR